MNRFPELRLLPMSEGEFSSYLAYAVKEYADEHIRAGSWSAEEGYEKAKQQYDELLPQGVSSPGHYLCSIFDADLDSKVGMIWYFVETQSAEKRAIVYDIRIGEQFRRRGYGSRTFELLEDAVRTLGAKAISLHVFAANLGARAMYQKLGFKETNIIMRKKLGEKID